MKHRLFLAAPSVRTRRLAPAWLLGAATLAAASPGLAAPADGRWLVRAGGTHIEPKSDNGTLSAGDITVDDQIGPSVNLAYFLTPNWAIDVLGALPFKHDFALDGDDAGSTRHLPPTLSLQYHPLPAAAVQPYVGVGLNYTLFMDEELDSDNDLDLDPSWGLAAQVGVDVPLQGPWRLGLDARYIDIDTDASVDGQGIGEIQIDPLVFSLNLGYRF